MAKTWSADNPKAALMARKRAALVDAALKAFLESGYAATSVNHIAALAGVSIKTLYRHFANKDDLFAAVMHAACGDVPQEAGADPADRTAPEWYALPPIDALPKAGEQYLQHVLSADQLALYRVVVRDAHQFPELGRRYHEVTTAASEDLFVGYLDRWGAREGWHIRDKRAAAQVFVGVLKAGIFDEALVRGAAPSDPIVVAHARRAAERMLALLASDCF